ncbi:uracil-DNA glycosylase [Kangiella sediminilitoris]|uniref:Uracil-DNA glycosylase n=1 Tax=Kangiella sediminilitoris TaxID=1144748 RepID=A0A1B3B8P5_9GAMM|nr:uracil-DNA glycosylase [Kangiella sediminilitoris]AOE49178.1 Uracil-DNA glycosylase [Kangiella sediminilitoris]
MTTWSDVLGSEKEQPYFLDIINFLAQERASGKQIYPPKDKVFNAFKATEFDQVKVVILGQDPYHGPNQAHGLCFSVQPGIKTPPSLANIYKELANSIDGFQIPQHGYLQHWADQGVLLLNTVLTVEQGKAHSHAKIGWEQFTDKVVEILNQHRENLVFLLWGSHAKKKGESVDRNRHLVLTAPHPSPLSAHRGFFGCNHFVETNDYLKQQQIPPIDWRLPTTV